MSGTVRVLVVDDAAFMRRTLVKLLRQAADVEVVGEARNGEEAVRLFASARPDVVCLDIDMPAMDGITALKHFMSARPTPVIVVSSMTDRDNVPFELFRLGIIEFFPKPTSLVGAIEHQTKVLLDLVRNARAIRAQNIVRVALKPGGRPPAPAPADRLRHLLVVAGDVGSVGVLVRLVSLLPQGPGDHGLGVVCMIPLHDALASSFRESLGSRLGWSADTVETSARLWAGRVYLLRPGSRVAFPDFETCQMEAEDAGSPDELFARAARAMKDRASMVLLAGAEPAGVEGLAVARSYGSYCYVQDPETALFSTWQPNVPEGIPLLRLESVATSVIERLAKGEAAP